MSSGDFPVMQDNSGFNLEGAALQMGMMRASGQTPSAPWAAARGLAQAVARAELGSDGELDAMRMPF